VDAVPRANAEQTHVDVDFRIQEGPRVFVDHVLIVGNVRTRAETIARELQVKAGDPYNLSAIIESQRRLVALGLFRRARITELRHGNETTRDLLVTIEEAPPMTIGYGVGAEGKRLADTRSATGAAVERFDIAPRALFEIGRRNLFGKNRSASLFTSVSRSVVYSLTEYRAVATFREPRLFDSAADAFINGTFEQQHRSTFDFARRSFSANVERRFSGPYRLTGTYQLQRTHVFNSKVDDAELPLIDRTFPQFLLSSFSGSVIRDTRDDALDTHDGAYASANAQLAGQAIGSEVGFVKSFVTAQVFRTVPHLRRVVVAGSARVGMARAFSTEGQLPASERFFAGGDTTVRGFALDQLGVRHSPSRPGDTVDANGFAIGGNGLTIFNAELRVPVTGGIGVVGFLDTGNVFARVADVDLSELRSAVGGGLRYKSPVGPLRFDIGLKIGRQPGESRAAWFVSFGQAF
jgi:outer membrane protein assembly complex protein YaeT